MRAYHPGAAANLYDGDPLLIVYGTRGSAERTALYRDTAEALVVFAGAGGTPMAVGRIPVKADSEVSSEDLARCNLILLGSVRDNLLSARIAGKLPFTINERNELIAGKREPVSLDNAALCLAYYNPLSPSRLIYLVATDAPIEDARRWFAAPQDLLLGSSGLSRVNQPDLQVQACDGTVRRRMQFTDGWQWRQVEGADVRLPVVMATANALRVAALRAMQRAVPADFYLEWGDEENPMLYDPQYFTLADMATNASPHQLLVGYLTGEELSDVYKKPTARIDPFALALPADLPANLDPQRLYRVAMSPDLCWFLMSKKHNLHNVQAMPDWPAELLWKEVFSR